jgi:hypothetical protein
MTKGNKKRKKSRKIQVSQTEAGAKA